jgi:hypothetical protein
VTRLSDEEINRVEWSEALSNLGLACIPLVFCYGEGTSFYGLSKNHIQVLPREAM